MGAVTAPLPLTDIKTIAGDAESKTEYLYEREAVTKYGLPTTIKTYTNDSLKNYKTLEYAYETSSTFANKYMLAQIEKEKNFNAGGTLLKETQTTYYEGSGNCGAIDMIKKLVASGSYLTWGLRLQRRQSQFHHHNREFARKRRNGNLRIAVWDSFQNSEAHLHRNEQDDFPI